MELDLARLRALVAVVDHGSFDAAADALHVTASAVSQRIRALERDVGRVLVVRARPVRATEHGAALLRLARQLELLSSEAEQVLRDDATASLPIAVNSDSLITWVLPALAPLAGEIPFEFQRDDQSRTAELLRNGTVVAAISSDRETVQGCAVRPLGVMRYRPVATPTFRARWFGKGRPGFAAAPLIEYDESDSLQRELLARVAPGAAPPRHRVPGSGEFVKAVANGFGWGMVPELQLVDAVERIGALHIDVPLFWHSWSFGTATLERVTDALFAAAAANLRPAER
ncbi:ArgP/LysG family DNA-binding transcriptional regulator [Gulosibacter massiliensis]|uniref:ArgP/LysG family DNA-binding transcriptional regulator n=1 Tax=Gulosibacter massiliensis TaxID=2479839 RepID=UPI000F6391AE|nr:ArgP/LysG family DNA-binding transcriptional regulator [Gulosibacter massiliensis]